MRRSAGGASRNDNKAGRRERRTGRGMNGSPSACPAPPPSSKRDSSMRHRVAHRKLGRVTEHRIAMLRNQATALLRYEHLTTTVPRAKELRPFVERIITIAKRSVAAGANGNALHARRLVMHDLQDQEVVTKMFDTPRRRFGGGRRFHAPLGWGSGRATRRRRAGRNG